MTPFRATVLTLYPDMFPGPLGRSLAGRALDDGRWRLEVRNIRHFAEGKHRTVDGPPAGGGPGLVLRADVAARAIDAARPAGDPRPLWALSARGEVFRQPIARELAAGSGVVLLCGRFEGIDERVLEARDAREVSVGDYVLSGGEIAAMAVLDAAVRLLPGVMGDADSAAEESHEEGLLEYPQYTPPRWWEGRQIPDVLLGGDHAKIAAWRRAEAERITAERRPDLWRSRGKGEHN